jgi:hypothetical protein
MTFENFFFLPGSAKAAGGQRMMGHGRLLSSKLHLDILSQYPSKANLMLSTGVTLATLGKHKHFGEMALIQETASVRSTSIIANTHV